LRTRDRGNGPIRCAFHDWRYSAEGQATGIPMCRELYGKAPKEMNIRLTQIEIATCGSLIFARFPISGGGPSLEDYLGEMYPILATMCRLPDKISRTDRQVAANWKLEMHVSLEEYHLPSVHPKTVGQPGHLKLGEVVYERTGLHNAFLYDPNPEAFRDMLGDSRVGIHWRGRYAIIHVFPSLMISQIRTAPYYWFSNIQVYAPASHNRTNLISWSFVTPVAERGAWWDRLLKKLLIRPSFGFYLRGFRRTIDEDRVVCERLQANALQFGKHLLLGAHEKRIEWFEATLTQALADDPARFGVGSNQSTSA
jgi:phenylpropionate dioxygenase-like ring-hydroxylating dioxygenase large terminal subunit